MKQTELTLENLIDSNEFRYGVRDLITKVENRRMDAEIKYGKLKRNPFQSLNEEGLLDTDKFIDNYKKVISKSHTGLSSSKRAVIKEIGDEVLFPLIRKIKSDNK